MAVHRATHASNATVSSSDITIVQGELFSFPDDDKPTRGYRGTVASKVAGITYRQLDYWARKQIVEPSIKASHGSGSRRLYSFKDVLILAVSKRLLDAGVNLQNVTIAIGYLMQRSTAQLEHTTILSDGEHRLAFLCLVDKPLKNNKNNDRCKDRHDRRSLDLDLSAEERDARPVDDGREGLRVRPENEERPIFKEVADADCRDQDGET